VATVVLVALPTSGFAYLLLFALIGGESAGVPLPGETALITGGILASQGSLSIPLVIVVAAGAAIIGDNFGYLLGRQGARRILVRDGWMEERRRALVVRGETFFEQHGAKTVFFGRWLPFLRVTAAWLAGAHRMHWATFVLWNAAGGIAWAVSVGLLAYFAGSIAIAIIDTAGYVVIGIIAVVLVSLVLWALARWLTSRSSASDGSR
jgi:membrane protein DedA with SNARE-associated domain